MQIEHKANGLVVDLVAIDFAFDYQTSVLYFVGPGLWSGLDVQYFSRACLGPQLAATAGLNSKEPGDI